MNKITQPIFTGFGDHIRAAEVWQALAFLLLPWRWPKLQRGGAIGAVETWLKTYHQTPFALTFDSGRSALFFALKALGLSAGDEVLVQAYTCLVVINAIRWTGARPRYVDIRDDFTMDPADVSRKVSPAAKVMIIQHTFGTPANLTALGNLAKKNNLTIIEDCAHALGARYESKPVGTFGAIGMFSFGADKVASCWRGGALITADAGLAARLKNYHRRLPEMRRVRIIQHLLYYPLFALTKPIYFLGIGKGILWAAKQLHATARVIALPEKKGKQLLGYPSHFSNALASLLLPQLQNLDQMNARRRAIAERYMKEIKNSQVEQPMANAGSSIFLRYTIFAPSIAALHRYAKKQGILLGNWYDTVIAPGKTDPVYTQYQIGECPHAEAAARESLNLPTHSALTDAAVGRVIDMLNQYQP